MVREDLTNDSAHLLHPVSFPCSFPLALILDVPAALFSGRLPTSWGCAAKPTSFLTPHTHTHTHTAKIPVILSPVSTPSLFLLALLAISYNWVNIWLCFHSAWKAYTRFWYSFSKKKQNKKTCLRTSKVNYPSQTCTAHTYSHSSGSNSPRCFLLHALH